MKNKHKFYFCDAAMYVLEIALYIFLLPAWIVLYELKNKQEETSTDNPIKILLVSICLLPLTILPLSLIFAWFIILFSIGVILD